MDKPKEDTEWQARQEAGEKPFEPKEDWELSFDKMIHGYHGNGELVQKDEFFYKISEIKAFIKSVEKEAFKEGYDAAKEDYHILD